MEIDDQTPAELSGEALSKSGQTSRARRDSSHASSIRTDRSDISANPRKGMFRKDSRTSTGTSLSKTILSDDDTTDRRDMITNDGGHGRFGLMDDIEMSLGWHIQPGFLMPRKINLPKDRVPIYGVHLLTKHGQVSWAAQNGCIRKTIINATTCKTTMSLGCQINTHSFWLHYFHATPNNLSLHRYSYQTTYATILSQNQYETVKTFEQNSPYSYLFACTLASRTGTSSSTAAWTSSFGQRQFGMKQAWQETYPYWNAWGWDGKKSKAKKKGLLYCYALKSAELVFRGLLM